MSAKNRNPRLLGDPCRECEGTGVTIDSIGLLRLMFDCHMCHGTGLVNSPNACTKCHGRGSMTSGFQKVDCDQCHGSGLEPPRITFSYEGVRYSVAAKAYNLNKIVLPDGKVLEATSWLESSPPQPVDLHPILNLLSLLPVDQVAKFVKGAPATKIPE